MLGTQRIVVFTFMVLAITLGITLDRLLSSLFAIADLPNYPLLGPGFTLTSAVATVVGVGGLLYCWRSPKVSTFSNEVVGELQKVTWPTKKETQRATIVVIVTTIVISLILGLFDLVWSNVTGVIYATGPTTF